MKTSNLVPEKKSWLVGVVSAGLLIGALVISNFINTAENNSFICSLTRCDAADYAATPIQLQAIVHYATSPIVPQLSLAEVSVPFEVLKARRSPCNFLIF